MIRFLSALFLIALLSGPAPNHAQTIIQTCSNGTQSYSIGSALISTPCPAVASFAGPGDVVAGPVYSFGLRAFNAAYAAAGSNMIQYRRASDSTLQNGVSLASGAFDMATANTFAGTDATASCTLSGTSATCSGASATIHVNDTVTGVGIIGPCFVTATNGSTTATLSLAGPRTTCGTVGSAETLTFQVALFVHTAYDMSGNGFNANQTTNGSQPQLLPNCNGALPCIYFNGSTFLTVANSTAYPQPDTYSFVGQFNGSDGTLLIAAWCAGQTFIYSNSPGNAWFLNATSPIQAPATDNAFHAAQGVVNNTFSTITIDNGTPGTGAAGTSTCSGGGMQISGAGGASFQWNGYMEEVLFYSLAFTNTQITNMTTNQLGYW